MTPIYMKFVLGIWRSQIPMLGFVLKLKKIRGIFVLKFYNFVFHGMKRVVLGRGNLTKIYSMGQRVQLPLAHQTWDERIPSYCISSHPTYQTVPTHQNMHGYFHQLHQNLSKLLEI
ncbi:hypothetical protein DVH24_035882 [Malus domestica]|uniref:Uncharacterized protein n=1 Tax=Malus domestica TaxID=3750 RepID=A0A498JTR5_MALDO|nr:hypothetical protein DVH24_035882 [Malus domestica]